MMLFELAFITSLLNRSNLIFRSSKLRKLSCERVSYKLPLQEVFSALFAEGTTPKHYYPFWNFLVLVALSD